MTNDEFLEVAQLLATGRYFPTKEMGQRFAEKAERLVGVVQHLDPRNPNPVVRLPDGRLHQNDVWLTGDEDG